MPAAPTFRTSQSHPLQIATLAVGGGRLGLTFCPGKYQPDAVSGAWARCLHADLDVVLAWGASHVVTLNEGHELEALRVPGLGVEVARRGLEWLHLPIVDRQVPDAVFEGLWPAASSALHAALASGRGVLIHCKGGLGRTGTIAARLLIEHGLGAEEAIRAVRAVRPGAIENARQEGYVLACGRVQAARQ
jgi:ADP-ribosyl-[dinitrogen reductase] hydrolase